MMSTYIVYAILFLLMGSGVLAFFGILRIPANHPAMLPSKQAAGEPVLAEGHPVENSDPGKKAHSSSALFVQGLSKKFGKFGPFGKYIYTTVAEMSNQSIDLDKKGILGVVGKNGEGKSTTIHMLLRLVRPTSGQIDLLGEPIWPRILGEFSQYNRLGVILEEDGFYPNMSGIENLLIFADLLGVKDAASKIENYWKKVGLSEEAKKRDVGKYSRGMKQRLAIARALLSNPVMLIFDDPTAGLDETGVEMLMQVLNELSRQEIPMVIGSHNPTEFLEHICTQIVVVHEHKYLGPVKREGSLAQQVEYLKTYGEKKYV